MKRGSDQTEQVGVAGLAAIAEVKQAEEEHSSLAWAGATRVQSSWIGGGCTMCKAQYGRCESEQLNVNM